MYLVYSLFLLTLFGPASVNAQSKSNDNGSKPPIGFGVNFGNLYFTGNTTRFGIWPNVAYRIGESAAIGVMVKMDYHYLKAFDYTTSEYGKFSAFDIGPTVFARWKPLWTAEWPTPFLRGLFLQLEYEKARIAYPTEDASTGGFVYRSDHKIKTTRVGEDYAYAGLGFTSGYPWGFFFSLHYNLLDEYNLSRIPWDYRAGVTYNY